MVFESAVTGILNKYLGKYIEKLDSKNLSVGIWNGDAILQDLELKKDALSELDLPIEVNWGYVGKLTLNIPWSSIYTKPVIIKLEDVYVLAGPTAEKPYDDEKEKGFAVKTKRRQLKQIEKAKRKKNNEPKLFTAENDTFMEKLRAQIIKNIQISIHNVHIRYEDKITDPESPFTAGITLTSLSAETTDQYWKPKVVDAAARKIHKLLSLESLSVYLNTDSRGSMLFNGRSNLKNLMKTSIQTERANSYCHNYILEPLSAISKVSIDQSSNVVENLPKVLVDVIQEELNIALSRRQFLTIMDTIDSFRLMKTNQPYRKYKPLRKPRESPKAWWRYAFTCIAETSIRPWTWKRIKEHRCILKEYTRLYRKKLIKRRQNKLPGVKLDAKIRALEDTLNIANILIARQQAENEMLQYIDDLDSDDSSDEESKPNENESSWWGWLGFGGKPSEDDRKEEEDDLSEEEFFEKVTSLSEEEKKKLYDAIGYSEEVGNPVYPKEYVKYKLNMSLKSCKVDLQSKSGRSILTLALCELLVAIKQRPGSNGFSVESDVSSLNIIGSADVANIAIDRPWMVRTTGDDKEEQHLLMFKFAINPLDVKADYSVLLRVLPLTITFDMGTIKGIQDFFTIPETEAVRELEVAASARLTDFTDATRAGVEYAIMQNRSTFIDAEVKSPQLIIPYNALGSRTHEDAKVLAVNLGDLKILTDLNTELPDQQLKEATESDLETMFYNRTSLSLQNTSIAVELPGLHDMENGPDFILPPTTIELQLCRSLKTGYANFPDFKIFTELKILTLNLSEEKLMELINVISYMGTWKYVEGVSQENTGSVGSISKGSQPLSSSLSLNELKNLQFALAENVRSTTPKASSGVGRNTDNIESPDVGSDALSDENPWFDAEEDFVEGVANKEDEVHLGESYESEMSLFDRTKLTCKIILEQVSVNFMKSEDGKEILYLWWNIQSCSVDLNIHLWDLSVDLRIGATALQDLLHRDSDGRALQVIDSPLDRDLISVNYIMADATGPEFRSKFRQTESQVSLEFGKIVVHGKEDSLASLSKMASRLSLALSSSPIVTSPPPSRRQLPSIPEESRSGRESEDLQKESGAGPLADDKLDIMVNVTVSEFTVMLSNSVTQICHGTIQGLDLRYSQGSTKTEVIARQRSITVTDLLDKSYQCKVLSVVSSEEDLLFIKIVMYSASRKLSFGGSLVPQINQRDMDIIAKLSKLNFVFQFSLVRSCQNIFAVVTDATTPQETREPSVTSVQNQVSSLRKQSQRILLDINIDAPTIFVPVKRGATDGFSVDLGQLNVGNSFKYQETTNPDEIVLIDSIVLNLQDFVFRSSLTEKYENVTKLTPINIRVAVDRSLSSWCSTVPVVDVHVNLHEFQLGLSKDDIGMFLEVLNENIGETVSSVDSEIKFESSDHASDLVEDVITPSDISTSTVQSSIEMLTGNDELTSVNKDIVLAKCSVQINKIALLLCEDLNSPRLYLTFEANDMKTAVEIVGSKALVSLNLQSVALKDSTRSEIPLHIVSSPHGKDLISINFEMIPGSDEFTNLDVTNQIFELSFSGLDVNIERSSLAKLAGFLQEILDQASKLSTATSLDAETAIKEIDSVTHSNQQITRMKLVAIMEQMKINFLEHEMEIAVASMEGLAVRGLLDENQTFVNCSLRNFSVDDRRQGSFYPYIFSVQEDNMLVVEFTLWSDSMKKAKSSSMLDKLVEDGTLKVIIGKVKTVFMYKFFMDIIEFFDPLMKVFVSTSQPPTKDLKRYSSQIPMVVEYVQSPFKLALDMNIHAPLILVPRMSSSLDVVVVDMGNLRITNHFDSSENVAAEGKVLSCVIDNIRAVLTDAMISRGRLDLQQSKVNEVPIVSQVDVEAYVNRYLHPTEPEIKIFLELPELKVSLTESDLNLLSFVFTENMAEGQVPIPALEPVPIDVVPAPSVDVVPAPSANEGSNAETVIHREEITTPVMQTKILVSVICKAMKVLLLSDSKNKSNKLREEALPLCDLIGDKISVRVRLNPNGSIDVNFAIQSLTGDDVRPNHDSYHRKVFTERHLDEGEQSSKDSSEDLVSAEYLLQPTGEQRVDVIVKNAAVFLSFEFVTDLLEFFRNTYVPEENETSGLQERTTETTTEQFNLTLTGDIIKTDVFLLEDPMAKSTHTIIAKINSNVHCKLLDQSIMMVVDVRPIELVFAQFPDIECSGRSLLRPCELKLQYRAPVKDQTGQDIGLTFSPMKFCLSPSLVATILQIMDVAIGTQGSADKEVEMNSKQEESLSLWEVRDLDRESLENINGTHGPSVLPSESTGDQIDINMELLELILGNDMKGMVVPLVTSKISLRARVMDWTSLLKVESDVTIEASFFNDKLGAWEPLLEPHQINQEILPYELNIKIFTDETRMITFKADDPSISKSRKKKFSEETETDGSNQDRQMATFVIINSSDMMQLTVTPKVIDITQQLLQGWNVDALKKTRDSKLQSPLHFENQLGVPVTVWVSQGAQVSGRKGKILTIKEYENVSRTDSRLRRVTDGERGKRRLDVADGRRRIFSVPEATPSSSDASLEVDGSAIASENPWLHCGDHTDCIAVLVKGFKSLKHVSIQCAGKWLYPLMPEKSFFVSYLVCEVNVKLGMKTVLLRSPLQVRNSLPVSINLWHIDISAAESESTESIADCDQTQVMSGMIVSLPLDRVFETYFFVQAEGYQRSIKFVTWRRLKDKERTVLQCSAVSTHESPPYYITVHSSYDKFDKEPPEFVPKHVIEFLPPIRIHNFLTSDITVTFKSGPTEFTQEFPAGLVTEVVHFQPLSEFDMNIEMVSYKGKNWTGSATIKSNHDGNKRVRLQSNQGEDANSLTIEISQRFDKSLDLWIHSRFWLLNKTGIPLDVKISGKRDVYRQGVMETDPLFFSYEDASKTKAALSTRGGPWTKFFSLNAVGDESSVVCTDSSGDIYEIYVNMQLSNTGRTKIVTCSPKHLITNSTKYKLSYLEQDAKHSLWRLLEADSCNPFWPQTKKKMMYLKLFDDTSTSQVFPFGFSYKAVLRLNDDVTVSLEVSCLGNRVMLNIKDYEIGMAPVRIDNYCEGVMIDIFQRNVGIRKTVGSLCSCLYSWDDLTKSRVLMWTVSESNAGFHVAEMFVDGWGRIKYIPGVPAQDRHDGSGERTSCINICRSKCCQRGIKRTEESQALLDTTRSGPRYYVDGGSRSLYWISHLDGRQRVLSFTDSISLAKKLRKVGDEEELKMDIFISLFGVGISMVNSVPNEILYISLTGGTSVWHVETKPDEYQILDVDASTFLEDAWRNAKDRAEFEDKIEADLNSMVMTKPVNGRLVRTCDPALWIQYCTSENNMSLHVKLHRLQVDNQQYDVMYLTSLYPTPLSPRVIKRTGVKPFAEFSVITSTVGDVTVIKYLKLLLQEFNLKVDKAFLMGILEFYYKDVMEVDELTSYTEDVKMLSTSIKDDVGNVTQSCSPAMVIEYFHLSPIKVQLSFSLQGGMSTDSAESVILEWLINTVGIHLTDISDAEIQLAFYERRNMQLTQEELQADFVKHYTLQAVKQFHVIVLGLDVLGNPYGLVTDIGQGFKDFFYEPYRGVVSGPHEFAEGLAYGVRSLLGHTIGGTFGAASKITEQLGQAVAALSFDTDYQRRRRAQMSADPSGIGEGLAIGGKNFVMGIVFGISGLVTKPVQGARKGGLEGFFKGVGKGLLGVFVKPTGGVIDLVTSTLDGVRRFAEQGGEDIPCRVRLPRLTYAGKVLQPYSKFNAEGYGLLRAIKQTDDSSECYVYHTLLPQDDSHGAIIILTDKRMIKAHKTRFFEAWKITWSDNYTDIDNVSLDECSVVIRIKDDILASPGEPDDIRVAKFSDELHAKKLYDKLVALSQESRT